MNKIVSQLRAFVNERGINYLCRTEQNDIVNIALLCLQNNLQNCTRITASTHAADYLKLQFKAADREIFGVMFLDNRNHFLSFEKLFYGTINAASVHPRIVVKRALELNAAAVILAHNHLSGEVAPSDADKATTTSIVKVLEVIDVKTLDHIIVSHGKSFSFTEHGFL